jgi:ATP adenylyltransferase
MNPPSAVPHPADDTGQGPLWAPWRIGFIRTHQHQPGSCFICAKAATPAEDLASYVIARGQHAYMLLNAYPYAPGHLLICPYRHIASLGALTRPEREEILSLSVSGEAVLRAAMQPMGFNLGCNLGKAAGAAVADHLHWHLVPRWVGDTNFMPILTGHGVIPESLDATTLLLRQTWDRLSTAGELPS